MLDSLLSAFWLTVLTVFVSVVTVELSALVLTVCVNVVMDDEFSPTVCESSLKVDVSTFSDISPSASDILVSNDDVLLIVDDRLESVWVIQAAVWVWKVCSPSISPSASISLWSAAVTSESLMSCQLKESFLLSYANL